jgi:hypothetical protein
MSSLSTKYWLIIKTLLFLILISGSVILGINLYSHRPVEISLTQQTPPEYPFEIFISGAVQNPGTFFYLNIFSILSLY